MRRQTHSKRVADLLKTIGELLWRPARRKGLPICFAWNIPTRILLSRKGLIPYSAWIDKTPADKRAAIEAEIERADEQAKSVSRMIDRLEKDAPSLVSQGLQGNSRRPSWADHQARSDFGEPRQLKEFVERHVS